MARTHSEIQERKTGSHQDIEDAGVEGMLDLLFPERADLYTGSGAVTARDMESPGITRSAIIQRAEAAVEKGDLVEVKVEWFDGLGRCKWTTAWVPKDVYIKWEDDRASEAT